MKREILLKIVENLTGKEAATYRKPDSPSLVDCALLDNLLHSGNPLLGWNELNELLLICNKDTISEDFFTFFFLRNKSKITKKLSLDEINKGISFFRRMAMLRFGNFIYAFETLCKKNENIIVKILGGYARKSTELLEGFKDRPNPLHRITLIDSTDTHFLGYLTAGILNIDSKVATVLKDACDNYDSKKTRKKICDFILTHVKKNERGYSSDDLEEVFIGVEKILSNYFKKPRRVDVREFEVFISKSALKLVDLHNRMMRSRNIGNVNTGIYLTWDYMDVYLATSMRKKWEFETVSKFAKQLFNNKKLQSLQLRYFDPTQSAEESRINKGLIEGLMLKRAKCTIYSVQDTDTLGKDSELASTLAQGKPVIAYVPEIENVSKHAKNLMSQPLEFFIRKLPTLYETIEKTKVKKACLTWVKNNNISYIKDEKDLEKFLNSFNDDIQEYMSGRVWNSIETPWCADDDFKKKCKKKFTVFCNLISITDKFFYENRAKTLQRTHPLALQVNLTTGVANGVLVVRKIDKCAELLYNILLNKAEFEIEDDKNNDCICLREKISGCIFRVVTCNKRLTNSFWNFYLYSREKGCYYVEKDTF